MMEGQPISQAGYNCPNTWLPDGTGYTEKVDTDQAIMIHLCPNVLSIGGIEKGYIPTNPSHHGYVQALPVTCDSLGHHAS